MGNATGIIGMIFGLIACVLSILIITSLIGVILGITTMILSKSGIEKNDKKAFGIVGLVFSIIAIAIGLCWIIVIAVWWVQTTA